jgi:hypothetical protein
MGRPSKLTPKTANMIVLALESGASIRLACKAAGIDKATYHRWLERGQAEQDRQDTAHDALDNLPRRAAKKRREAAQRACQPHPDEEPFREFCDRAMCAHARGDVELLGRIRAAARAGDWRAAAWLAERRIPELVPPKQQVEHQGSETQPVRSIVALDVADPVVREHAAGLLRARLAQAEREAAED